ncbi:hypothetical protein MKL09_12145 [Methylobacterium sp. J-048]|uniref:hypothetical protein n=1 Tax=Methylobacterium sp. J-048 TaxID=2836635 RepID=UPI001FBBD0A9|nr:hypothetical protein [Methylobacterium sp. J-048]MCJ2057305.1 hypothetical protein [Methylobacterium sp. J-048]
MSASLDPALQAKLARRFSGQSGFQSWLARQGGTPAPAPKAAAPEPTVGSHWSDEDGPVRVMAVVEGYVVARRKGAMPFSSSARDFAAAFKPVEG